MAARNKARAPDRKRTGQGQNALRITGGEWRGRKLTFQVVDGLRPTLSQGRERLFNWLQYELAGKTVLDAYAGSGALGLEALSRGAAHCDFVELNRTAASVLQGHLETLSAIDRGQVHATDVLHWLTSGQRVYDLVFLDPPFAEDRFQQALDTLATSPVVGDGTLVYLETPVGFEPAWPDGWAHWKHRDSGRIQQIIRRVERPEAL